MVIMNQMKDTVFSEREGWRNRGGREEGLKGRRENGGQARGKVERLIDLRDLRALERGRKNTHTG